MVMLDYNIKDLSNYIRELFFLILFEGDDETDDLHSVDCNTVCPVGRSAWAIICTVVRVCPRPWSAGRSIVL